MEKEKNQIQKIIQIQDQLDLLLKQLLEVNNYKQPEKIILHNSGVIEPDTSVDIEILAGRGGAFKPLKIQLYAIDETGQVNISFEIVNVAIMGLPQLVNYAGGYTETERGLIKTFENFVSVNWNVFGSSRGQGLSITVRNMNKNKKGIVYAAIKGYPADCFLIGKT